MNRSRVGGTVAVVLLTALSAVACGEGVPEDLVTEGNRPARPYSGPLYLPHPNAEGDTPQARRAESGPPAVLWSATVTSTPAVAANPGARATAGRHPRKG